MSLTPEQEQAAHAPSSVSITAGAGTGKTYMLAERYYFHLEQGDLSPLDIVAMTFTNKAAAELRSRIRQAIASHAPDRTDWLAEVEAAQISTFHALASRICREHPEAAGVPADFVALDEWEGDIWQAEQLAIALDQLPSDFYEKIPYSLMRTAIAALLNDPLSAQNALNKKIADWFPELEKAKQQALDNLLKNHEWQAALACFQSCSGQAGDKIEEARQAALDAMEAIEQREKIDFHLGQFTKISLRGGSAKKWQDAATLEIVKSHIKTIKSLIEKVLKAGLIVLETNELDQLNQNSVIILEKAFNLVWKQIADAKKQQRILDFNDLEVYALQALKSPEVCEYYHQRWQAFLIDEFQDTNPTQGKLLEALTAKATLTIVGDEKQSIYSFRRADVQVFQAWRSRLEKSVSLTTSFRTHHSLIHNINTIFAPVLEDLHQNLVGDRQAEPHPAPHLEVFTVAVPEDLKTNVRERRQVEAQHIAEQVATMLQQKLPIWDKKQRCLRPLEPRDIAILARTWSPLEIYGQALEQRQIPFIQSGGGNLLDTREAKDAIALLKFLANPADNLALIALLRSPFFSISDRQLYDNRPITTDSYGKIKWWQQIKNSPDPDLQNAVKILQQLLNQRDRQPPTRLLQQGDRLTGYTAIIANLPKAQRRIADWRGMIAMVRQLEAGTGMADVLLVVRRLRRIIKSAAQIKRPPLEAENAVSLMTIHGSKGLEWSVVVVPDLTRKKPNDTAKILFDPHLGVALQTQDESGEKQTSALFTLLQQQQKQQQTAEAKRLLYVALTRAGDRLLLTAPDEKGHDLDLLKPGLDNHLPIQTIDYSTDSDITKINSPTGKTPDLPQKLLLQRARLNGLELPITSLTEYARCPQQFYYHYIEGHPGLSEGTTHHSAAIGSLTHKALEKGITNLNHLKKYASDLPETAQNKALELANKFRQGEIYKTVREGQWEKYLSFKQGRLILNGFADLVGDDFILDIKTDQQMKPATYRFQLWAYAKAAKKKQAYIAYLRHDILHHFTEEILSDIQEEVKDLLHNIEAQNYEPKPSQAACQYCSYADSTMCDVAIL